MESAQEKVAQTHGMPLPGLKKLTETKITNVTSKSFGIVVVVNENGDEGVQNLIMIDDAVPTNITQTFPTFADDQEGVDLRCMENTERRGVNDPPLPLDPLQEIGNAELRFYRPLPKDSPIEITFSLAPDGLLSIYGRDLTTDCEINAEFKTKSILSREELEQKKQHNMSITVSS